MINLVSVYKNLNKSHSILNFLAMIIINLTSYRYDEKDHKLKLASEKFIEKIRDDRSLTNLVQNLVLKASTKITAELLKSERTDSSSQLKEKLVKSIANRIKEKIKITDFLKLLVLKFTATGGLTTEDVPQFRIITSELS